MRAPSPALAMSDGQREVLMVLAKSQTAPHRQVQRAKALLLAADGGASTRIAEQGGVSPAAVASWREGFAQEGGSERGKARSGRGPKPAIPPANIDQMRHL